MSPPEEEPSDERWLDEHAGALVRPYVVTRGRITPIRGRFDLISLVLVTRPVSANEPELGPEHHAIIELCQEPLSVAEIAGTLDLPAGTVRVLLGDLLDKELIAVQEPQPVARLSDERLYEAVIDGLRAL
jgi:hypothetical protein